MNSNLKKGVLSSLLLVFDSVGQKLIGLVSTLILARVLLPEDFGIIAIATMMVGFISILSATGSAQYLMRVDDLDDEKIDTSFTINLIIKSFLSLLMLGFSFLIADFYGDPRLTPVLISLTFLFFFHAFTNPGTAYLKRAQNYKRLVQLTLFAKFAAVIAAILVAVIYESYWALVIAKAVSAVITVVGSHLIFDYKMRLLLKNAKEQWHFSGWMIPQAIFGYFRSQLDTLIVSSTFGQAALGSYHTMKYVAYIPSANFLVPMSEPFLVELTKTKTSKSYFTKQFKASFLLLMLIALPITSIMYFFHLQITLLLLGPNWLEYSYLMAAFGLLIPPSVMLNHAKRVLLIYAKTKQIFIYECIAFVVVYSVAIYIGLSDIKVLSFTLVTMENIVSLLFFTYILGKYTGIKSIFKFAISVIPLITGTAIASYVVNQLPLEQYHVFVQLITITTIFFVLFFAVIYAIFILGFKNISEWEYLENLLKRTLTPFLVSIRSKLYG